MIATNPKPQPAEPGPDLEFLKSWRREVETMRRGGDPDWETWSLACRGGWARNRIDLAAGEGIQTAWIRLELGWLGDVIRAGEGREPVKPDPVKPDPERVAERAAILEHDAGFRRADAERMALKFETDPLSGAHIRTEKIA